MSLQKENIIVGSGATELISSFISVINPKKLYYFLHLIQNMKVNLKKINCEITKFFFSREEDNFKIDVNKLIDSINSSKFDLVIICNPNNPTGFAFSKDEISLLLKILHQYSWLMKLMLSLQSLKFTPLLH